MKTGKELYEHFSKELGGIASPSVTGLKKPALIPWGHHSDQYRAVWNSIAEFAAPAPAKKKVAKKKAVKKDA